MTHTEIEKIQNYYTRDPANGGAPKQIVIVLHGYGSNGQDLISLAPYWAKYVPDAVFVSPDAPFPCEMMPPGYPNAYQWFSLSDRAPEKMLAGAQGAFPMLSNFIDGMLAKYKLSVDKLVLAGFSQGTMMILYTAPRYGDKIAGVLGYSGALIGAEDLNNDNMHKPPVCLIHGEADDVVPITAHAHAKGALIGAGFTVSGHTTAGLPHSIDEQGIEAGGAFLSMVLK